MIHYEGDPADDPGLLSSCADSCTASIAGASAVVAGISDTGIEAFVVVAGAPDACSKGAAVAGTSETGVDATAPSGTMETGRDAAAERGTPDAGLERSTAPDAGLDLNPRLRRWFILLSVRSPTIHPPDSALGSCA